MPPTKKARTARSLSNGSQNKPSTKESKKRCEDRDNLDIPPQRRITEGNNFTEYNYGDYPFGDGPVWAFRNDSSQPFLNSSSPPREVEGENYEPKPSVEYIRKLSLSEPELDRKSVV